MTLLRDEVTFGSNRVYLGFEKWGFETTYWGIVDELQIKQCYDDYNQALSSKIIKFIPKQFKSYFNGINYFPLNVVYQPNPFPQFARDFDNIYDGWSVSYMLLQLAYLLGYKEIYLVGMDYNYVIEKEQERRNNKWSDKNSINHFTQEYNADEKGVIWNKPNFEKTDLAYDFASNFLQKEGVKVMNATPQSKLKAFDFVKYEQLFV